MNDLPIITEQDCEKLVRAIKTQRDTHWYFKKRLSNSELQNALDIPMGTLANYMAYERLPLGLYTALKLHYDLVLDEFRAYNCNPPKELRRRRK